MLYLLSSQRTGKNSWLIYCSNASVALVSPSTSRMPTTTRHRPRTERQKPHERMRGNAKAPSAAAERRSPRVPGAGTRPCSPRRRRSPHSGAGPFRHRQLCQYRRGRPSRARTNADSSRSPGALVASPRPGADTRRTACDPRGPARRRSRRTARRRPDPGAAPAPQHRAGRGRADVAVRHRVVAAASHHPQGGGQGVGERRQQQAALGVPAGEMHGSLEGHDGLAGARRPRDAGGALVLALAEPPLGRMQEDRPLSQG